MSKLIWRFLFVTLAAISTQGWAEIDATVASEDIPTPPAEKVERENSKIEPDPKVEVEKPAAVEERVQKDDKSPSPTPTVAIPEMTNWDEIAKLLKLSRFKGLKFRSKLKIAVIDNGFAGYEGEIGKSLPKDTVYHPGEKSAADEVKSLSFHGLFMAQIVSKVISSSEVEADYELHLFNAYGYTKFADAINTVATEKFDLVLYAQVWEYGGNGDGKGFINTLVNKALDAGVIWINAAGNYGRLTKIAPVDSKVYGEEEWVVFKNSKNKLDDGVTLKCEPVKGDQCALRLVLSWNDFKDDADTGTDKDLDLYLLNSKKEVIASSERIQKIVTDPKSKMDSLFPRELIEINTEEGSDSDKIILKKGTYKIRAKVKSKNFSASQDKVKITVGGSGVYLTDPSLDETLLPPADNSRVIAIGASDDGQSSRSKESGVPEVYLRSLIKLKDGSNPFETSNAAAMAAGLAALHLGVDTDKTNEAIINQLKLVSREADEFLKVPPGEKKAKKQPAKAPQKSQANRYDDPTSNAQGALTNGCVQPRKVPAAYPLALKLLRSGSVSVSYQGRMVILIPDRDVIGLMRATRFPGAPMRMVLTPNGVRFFSRGELANLPVEYYELRRLAPVPICRR